MLNDLELVELLSARFCHDLAGPIGAISNGFEFLKENNTAMRERAFYLVEASAKQAIARLQFYRQLYGIVPSIGEANLTDLRSLAENFFAGSKVALNWTDENIMVPGVVVSHRFAKIILNLINISNGILIHGGIITVKLEKLPNGKRATITGSGQGFKLDEELLNILSNRLENISVNTKNVHIYLTMKLATMFGAKVMVNKAEDHVDFVIEHIKDSN